MRSQRLPDDQLLAIARRHVGRRSRGAAARLRRRRAPTAVTSPGARSSARRYRFDVLADYGAFRDLQRHRLLTLEWQPLSTRHGYTEPAAIEEAGALDDWREVMDAIGGAVRSARGRRAARRRARTRVVMAYRVRFYMDMNAREAMHVIELRTAPQGHPAYRRVCQLMHRAIARRRRPPRDRRRDAVRGSLRGGARAAAIRARAGEEAAQFMICPPQMLYVWPVIAAAPGEARNFTRCATSSG